MDQTGPIPSRSEYILGKKAQGFKVYAVFPGHYPKELFLAAGILPVEVWNVPISSVFGLQPFICGVVKSGLGFLQGPYIDMVDGLVFPHLCDSLQNLGSLANDLLGQKRPVLFFYPPKRTRDQVAVNYYREQLKALKQELKDLGFVVRDERLREELELSKELIEAIRGLFSGPFHKWGIPNQWLIRCLCGFTYMAPSDLLTHIERLKDGPERIKYSDVAVIISGILPYPMELFEHLDNKGVRVVGEDLLYLSRRMPLSIEGHGEPLEDLTRRYFSTPPCSTKGSSISERVEYLASMAEQRGAKGVIFLMVKFCEPEYFDLPILQRELGRKGIRSVVLETEPGQGLGLHLVTRLEAFLEGLL